MYNRIVKQRIHKGARDLWLPGLVVLLGWSISGLSWDVLVLDRQADLIASVQETAEDSADALAQRLTAQLTALEGLADLWALSERRSTQDWLSDAQLRIETRNGLSALAWFDPDTPAESQRAVGEMNRVAGLPSRVVDQLPTRSSPLVLGPERDDAGAYAYRILVPVKTIRGHVGTLVARVDVEGFLAPLLQARARGYAIGIDWNGERIYTRGRPTTRTDADWWHAETTVLLPVDGPTDGQAIDAAPGTWRVQHRPTDALADARLTMIPNYLLAAGLIVSLLLAAILHQWRLVSRQARFLEIGNRALEERGEGLQQLNAELERRVADRTERLEDAINELKAFNYSVSHDLRSPLGAVLNLAAILEEEYADRPLDAQGKELLVRIQRAATRATTLLEDLLQLSHTGQAVLSIEPIDTTALAREMFAQARAAEEEPDVELVLEPLPEVRADRTLLSVVFANLFSNAMKYSRGCEKRRVTVKGGIESDECVFEVADNGRGFDMRFAGKLFGLFERLHGDDEIEGTGVGLAMVARIVKRHGGRVWADGEVGEGARFGFSIRRTEGDES